MNTPSQEELFRRLADGEVVDESQGIFGTNFPVEESRLCLIPVPWDATASYHRGTAQAPELIRKASHQLDFYDCDFGEVYRARMAYLPDVIRVPEINTHEISAVNAASQLLNQSIYETACSLLAQKKVLGFVGGEHSISFSAIRAAAEWTKDNFKTSMGLLHVDAHHDLRCAYEGYEHSHASIMYNVMEQVPNIDRLVSVAIRDYSQQEARYAYEHHQIRVFYDREIQNRQLEGENFSVIAEEIIAALPEYIYFSFDIDGLDPSLCPHTGTPVPGGLSFAQAVYLMRECLRQNKKLVSFDLTEVACGAYDNDFNANVGARILYKLCGLAYQSRADVFFS